MTRKGIAVLASALLVALTLAAFVALQGQPSSISAQAIDHVPQIDLTQMEREFAAREVVYRQQMLELETLLNERRATYEQQIETLTQALAVGRSQLADLDAQVVVAEQQLTQFNSARGERQSLFLARRQETQNAYDVHYNQMVAQLAEVQAKLAEAQQILGQ